jgi:hypothetical protein
MKLNESPDNFYFNGKRVSYTRDDAVSFIVFPEGYAVYSTAGVEGTRANSSNSGHVALAEAWILKLRKENNIPLDEFQEDAWEFYKDHLRTIGKMGPAAKSLAEDFLSGDKSPWSYDASESMLKGRLWRGTGATAHNAPEMPEEGEEVYEEPLTDKVVSFWGLHSPDQLKPSLGLVVEMIKSLGEDPEEFYFELGYDFYPYSSISAGIKSKTDFDKEYKVGSSIYKYADFEKLRTAMHSAGATVEGKRAKETLCRIFTQKFVEENPELRGFLPSSDCIDITYQGAKKDGFYSVKPEIERGLAPTRELLRRKYGGGAAKRQIKGFMQGRGPEPVLPTISEPGQAAGIKGRTLGGFRGKTQKEIDAAWDDFMRKREQTSPDKISFKEWFSFLENFFFDRPSLLKEDPNDVPRNLQTGRAKVHWGDPYAITFILFKDYFVYAPTAKGAMHHDVITWLAFKEAEKRWPGGKAALEKFEKMNPWCGAVREVGTPGKGTSKTIEIVANQMNMDDGRNTMLRVNPEVILGRLWLQEKVVSFWNYWPYVTQASDRIMRFVSIFDDPKDFEYDIRNMAATYEDIAEKKLVPSSREVSA